jgi:hypothetical protein
VLLRLTLGPCNSSWHGTDKKMGKLLQLLRTFLIF